MRTEPVPPEVIERWKLEMAMIKMEAGDHLPMDTAITPVPDAVTKAEPVIGGEEGEAAAAALDRMAEDLRLIRIGLKGPRAPALRTHAARLDPARGHPGMDRKAAGRQEERLDDPQGVPELAAVLTEAELSRCISRTPAYRIELPPPNKGLQRFLTPEEINRLGDAIVPRYRVLILIAAYLGLRWGECAGLKAEDLDLDHGFAVIHRTLSEVSGRLHEAPTKGKPVVIPVPRFLCAELEKHIERYVGQDGYVFTSPGGGPLRHNVYRRVYKPALADAGLDPGLRFHDLRHTAASIAGSRQYAGEAAKVVQQLLRHSSQQVTTEVYMHLFPEDMERLRESLDRVYEEASSDCGNPDSDVIDEKPKGPLATVVSLSTRKLPQRGRNQSRNP